MTDTMKCQAERPEKSILILDYDGTIHDSMAIYEPAFRKAMRELEELGWMEPREYSREEIQYWIGYNAKEMWPRFQPEFTEKQQAYGSSLIGKYMCEAVESGLARLYPNADRVLKLLKQDYELWFLSNCKNAYLEANKSRFHLERYYDVFHSSEEFGFLPKEEIFRRIRIPGRNYLIVGDRETDLRMAKDNDLPFVGCLYGFCAEGELDGADAWIRAIEELPQALKSLFFS
jgi:phosphoglycolate phosphatase